MSTLLERVNAILGLPPTASLEECKAKVAQLQSSAAKPSAATVLQTLARMKVEASGGKVDLRTATLETAQQNPDLVRQFRAERGLGSGRSS